MTSYQNISFSENFTCYPKCSVKCPWSCRCL